MKSNLALLTSLSALCFGAGASFGQIAAVPAPPSTPRPEVTPAPAPAAVLAVAADPAEPEPPGAPATPEPPAAAPQIAYAMDWGGFSGDGGASPGRTLAILKDAAETKDVGEIEEDLNVMARILDKAVSGREDRTHNAMGIVIHSGMRGPNAAPRNLYLEGYGAVFFLNVNYPLVEPGNKKEEQSKDDANSEWEEARRELAQPANHGFAVTLPPVTPFGDGPAEDYDGEKVDKLKTDLISALKNAGHIRRLKSNEMVTVVVSGRGAGTEPRAVTRRTGRNRVTVLKSGPVNGEGSGARLVLRVRKSDVEAFQKDQTSLEDFRKKVAIVTY